MTSSFDFEKTKVEEDFFFLGDITWSPNRQVIRPTNTHEKAEKSSLHLRFFKIKRTMSWKHDSDFHVRKQAKLHWNKSD